MRNKSTQDMNNHKVHGTCLNNVVIIVKQGININKLQKYWHSGCQSDFDGPSPPSHSEKQFAPGWGSANARNA